MPPNPIKAYQNAEFLNGPHARSLRILSEYIAPRARLDRYKIRDTVVFFGSARFKDGQTAQADACHKAGLNPTDAVGIAPASVALKSSKEAEQE